MDRARGTGAATRGGPGAGTAARGGPGAGREGGGVRDSPGTRPRRVSLRRVSLRRAVPLAAPRRPPRRAAPLVTVALLHVLLVGMALLHAQGPRSVQ